MESVLTHISHYCSNIFFETVGIAVRHMPFDIALSNAGNVEIHVYEVLDCRFTSY